MKDDGKVHPIFFSEVVFAEKLMLPRHFSDISQVISASAEAVLISVRVIDTMKGVSCEGQRLSGKAAVLTAELKLKAMYASEGGGQNVFMTDGRCFRTAFIELPPLIYGTECGLLVSEGYLKPHIRVDQITAVQNGKRQISVGMSLVVELSLVPVQQLCYSLHQACKKSNIFLMRDNGSRNRQITFGAAGWCPGRNDMKENSLGGYDPDGYKMDGCKPHTGRLAGSSPEGRKMKPLWSPRGQEIAFLSYIDEECAVFIHSLKTGSARRLTNPGRFKSIASFCWSPNGEKIIFSAGVDDAREVFSVHAKSSEVKQLTNGNGFFKSFRPQCSPYGNMIAFLRSFSGMVNLWVCGIDGMELKKVTSSGSIRSFDWSKDGKQILFIRGMNGKPDEIHIADIEKQESRLLYLGDSVTCKRNVKYSPDNCSAAFIGTRTDTEDIYIYYFEKGRMQNVTCNAPEMKIGDFVWDVDSNRLFFTCNELFYYNIYSIEPGTLLRKQLTSTYASGIDLHYRPRIM